MVRECASHSRSMKPRESCGLRKDLPRFVTTSTGTATSSGYLHKYDGWDATDECLRVDRLPRCGGVMAISRRWPSSGFGCGMVLAFPLLNLFACLCEPLAQCFQSVDTCLRRQLCRTVRTCAVWHLGDQGAQVREPHLAREPDRETSHTAGVSTPLAGASSSMTTR